MCCWLSGVTIGTHSFVSDLCNSGKVSLVCFFFMILWMCMRWSWLLTFISLNIVKGGVALSNAWDEHPLDMVETWDLQGNDIKFLWFRIGILLKAKIFITYWTGYEILQSWSENLTQGDQVLYRNESFFHSSCSYIFWHSHARKLWFITLLQIWNLFLYPFHEFCLISCLFGFHDFLNHAGMTISARQ